MKNLALKVPRQEVVPGGEARSWFPLWFPGAALVWKSHPML